MSNQSTKQQRYFQMRSAVAAKKANQPVDMEVRVSSLPPCPHPPSFFPLALLPKQNCFQAAPLCSQCCGGGDLTSNSCSLFIFGKVAATSLIGFAIEALSAQLPTQLTLFENIRTDSCDHVKRCSSAFRAGNGVENLFEVTRSTEIEEVFFLATNAVECRLASTKSRNELQSVKIQLVSSI